MGSLIDVLVETPQEIDVETIDNETIAVLVDQGDI